MAALIKSQITLVDMTDVLIQSSEPVTTVVGTRWINTGSSPYVLYTYSDNATWVVETDYEILNAFSMHDIVLEDMTADGRLTPYEKSQLTKIISPKLTDAYTLEAQASALGSSTVTELSNAIGALESLYNTYITANPDGTSDVSPTFDADVNAAIEDLALAMSVTSTDVDAINQSVVVVLSKDSYLIPGYIVNAKNSTTTVDVTAYKATTPINVNVAVSGHVAGLATSVADNNTMKATVTVNTNMTMTTQAGSLLFTIIADGKTYQKYLTYAIALTGDFGYTISLSNESHTFLGSVSTALDGSASTQVIAFKGDTPLSVTFGSISAPTGMTITKVGDGTTNASLTFTVTPGLTPLNGQILIPMTIDGKAMSKTFSYSVSMKGTDGTDGTDGTKVETVATAYKLDDQGLVPPTTGWTEAIPAPVPGKYTWTKTVTLFDDGQDSTVYSVSLHGADGRSITAVDVEFASTTSNSVAPATDSPDWQTTAPAWAQGSYIWSRTKTTYSIGEPTYSSATCISGSAGSTGKGISQVKEQYSLSTSNTVANGTWQDTMPNFVSGSYIWTRMHITWTDASISTTAEVLANAINDANQKAIDVEVQTQLKAPFIESTHASSLAAWTAVAPFSALTSGQQITFLLKQVPTGSATLNLTLSGGATTGAINVYYGGTSRITTHYPQGSIIRLTYLVGNMISGAPYTGWWADANYVDGNNYDRIQYSRNITAKTAITAGRLIGSGMAGYSHLAGGGTILIDRPILYAASAIAAAGVGTNNYTVYSQLTLTSTFTIAGLVAQDVIYLKGELSGLNFTLNATTPVTKTPTDDGSEYMLLGQMYSATAISLYGTHELYMFHEGVFKSFAQIAAETSVLSAQLASKLLDMASDNMLTPEEKLILRRELDIIIAEKATIDSQADVYATVLAETLERSDYDAAYVSLNTYLTTTANIDLATTEAIDGVELRTRFSNYVTTREILRKRISDLLMLTAISALPTKEYVDTVGADARAEADAIAYQAMQMAIAESIAAAELTTNEALNAAKNYADERVVNLTDRVSLTEQKITDEMITQVVTSSSTYQENLAALEPIVFKQAEAPEHALNRLWLNTATTPNVMYRSDGVEWVKTAPTTAAEIGAYTAGEVDALASDLNSSVNALATTVVDLESSITSTAAAIRTEVAGTYTRADAFEVYKESVSTEFTQTKNAFNFDFTELVSRITSVDGKVDLNDTEIKKYIRFEDGKIYLGESTSAISLVIDNDQIAFFQQGNPLPVAYIQEDVLVIRDGQFLKSLRIGDFAFTPNPDNGNLSFSKVV